MSSIENKGKVIYLDNAATTKMSEEVKEAMDPYLEEKFGNASTMYGYGETSRQALEKARKTIAGTLEAKPSEIFFTSGGSESDNWAVKCIAGEYKHKGSRPPYPNSFPWKLEEKMMPVPKPIFRSGFLSPYAFPHSAAFFSIIMRILLLFPGLVISGARRSLLCSPFPLSHAVSMPVSTVIIMV